MIGQYTLDSGTNSIRDTGIGRRKETWKYILLNDFIVVASTCRRSVQFSCYVSLDGICVSVLTQILRVCIYFRFKLVTLATVRSTKANTFVTSAPRRVRRTHLRLHISLQPCCHIRCEPGSDSNGAKPMIHSSVVHPRGIL